MKRGDDMTKAEEFDGLLRDIANQLENARVKIFQEEKCAWEIEDNDYIDNRLFELQSQIRGIADIVNYIDFKIDRTR